MRATADDTHNSSKSNLRGEAKHFPRREDVTSVQLKKIAELRERLKEELSWYPDYGSDFQLLRWLMGYDYDIETIIPKLRHVLESIRALRVPELPVMGPEEINAFAKTQSKAAEHFPGGIMSRDRDGYLVVVEAMARVHPKTLCLAGPTTDLFRIALLVGESAQRHLRQIEEKEGRKLGAKLIMDLDGFSTDLLYRPTLKVYMTLLSALQLYFPDLIHRIYVINSPAMIHAAYALIQPVLAHQTREKIHFLGRDWKQKIIEEVGPDNVYPHWGGTKEPKDGKPTGDLRMGGRVPEHLWYRKEENLFDNDEGFTTISVPARSKKEVKMVGVKGETLRWLFRISSGDIDFSVVHEGRPVWPKFRVSTEFVPEFGSLECSDDGDFILIFDNSHGMIWSKDISYKVALERNEEIIQF